MELHLLNYADDRFNHKGGRFKQNQINFNLSAKKQGISNIISWNWEKLTETDFYKQNQEYLERDSHNNGFVWKPYIILDTLRKISFGDIVFYHDSVPWGLNRSINPLVDLCISNTGLLLWQYGQKERHKNRKWTKRDAFVYMGCDETKYHEGFVIQATVIFIQKNNFNLDLVSEWLMYNLDERIASSKPNTCGLPNLPGFVDHRHDQSILTNLSIKYNIKATYMTSRKDINLFIDLLNMPSFFREFYRKYIAIISRLGLRTYDKW